MMIVKIPINEEPRFQKRETIAADYMTQAKDMATFAFGDLTYKIRDSRFAIGLRGGVIKPPADKAEPFVGGVIKLRIF